VAQRFLQDHTGAGGHQLMGGQMLANGNKMSGRYRKVKNPNPVLAVCQAVREILKAPGGFGIHGDEDQPLDKASPPLGGELLGCEALGEAGLGAAEKFLRTHLAAGGGNDAPVRPQLAAAVAPIKRGQ